MMPSYRYVIVAGGMTADAACRGIRERAAEETIGRVDAARELSWVGARIEEDALATLVG